jgi:DNA-directed RNA polymerase subunit RPC12/RpoP
METTVAIRCERCGRDYDVTLFQFGRTVKCDCGATVRLKIDPATQKPPASPRRTREEKP